MTSLTTVCLLKLSTCHVYLQDIVMEVSSQLPLCVVVGWRNRADQEAAFKAGKSDKHFPDSPHNHMDKGGNPCAVAVDLAPKRADGSIDWDDADGFERINTLMQATAHTMGYTLKHWPIVLASGVVDRDHWELMEDEYHASH